MDRVEGIFWSNLPWWVKKIQPNPTHMGRVEPMDWTNFFITIIIKLSKKKYKYKYIKKTQRLVLIYLLKSKQH